MPILQVIRTSLAVIISVLGLIGLYIMLNAELATAKDFHNYFQWALGAGLVFMAVGAALTAYDRDDEVILQYDEEAGKK